MSDKSSPKTPPGVVLEDVGITADGGNNDGDRDSAVVDVDNFSSTASVAESVYAYRTIQGRTYHSDRQTSDYYAPIDDRQKESVDIAHHYNTLLTDGKLFLSPIDKSRIRKALDVGTGTGIWAIDFADEFPHVEVIGTDLSPIQPSWVPPNVRFEIDDLTQPWTWKEGSFDFVHMRNLCGSVSDWPTIFREAYRVLSPGSWVESRELEAVLYSDDETIEPGSALDTWGRLFTEAGKRIGKPFTVLVDDAQQIGIRAAGFVDVHTVDYKVPLGGWPANPKLKEIGQFAQLTAEHDMEGYSLLLWNDVLGWPKEDYQMFLMGTRKAIRDKSIHSYFKVRIVYGRKPERNGPE